MEEGRSLHSMRVFYTKIIMVDAGGCAGYNRNTMKEGSMINECYGRMRTAMLRSKP